MSAIHLRPEQTITLQLSSKNAIRFQIDNGADCNVLPLHVYRSATGDHELQKVKPSTTTLWAFGQKRVPSAGVVVLQMQRHGKMFDISCELVVGKQYHSVLGSNSCRVLGVLDVKDNDKLNPPQADIVSLISSCQHPNLKDPILAKHSRVFRDEVGCLRGEYTIRVDESVMPVHHAPRNVSVALRQPLQRELEKLVSQGIIAPVVEPTPWVSSLVVVGKPDGTLRICLDPKDLNKAIMRENYPLPTVEEVATRLSGAKVFSIFDVKQGFWHVELDLVSSLLTTFNTPFGRFRWCRMPFGISSASEVFQRRMHQLIEGLAGVEVVADDFLVFGSGETLEQATQDHDLNLQDFLSRCADSNVVLAAHKIRLRQREVPFIGHVATADGLKPDPGKVAAILDMTAPADASSMRRFLGMVQYLSKFMAQLAKKTAPLRQLLKTGVPFVWTAAQQQAFEEIKQDASNLPILRYYSLSDEVTIQSDASQTGLGAALLQNGQPVAYASRTLTDAETRYAQIEKECLSIVFACERFDQYIFGRSLVAVQTDHQPLESIFKKNLAAAPARLQRMLLRLQRYNLSVSYICGSHMFLADALSRAPLRQGVISSSFISSLETTVNDTPHNVSESGNKELQQATAADPVMQVLRQTIEKGWPAHRANLPMAMRAYFDIRDELTVDSKSGLIYKGDRIVVPPPLRRIMLVRAHAGHVGIGGCLRRLREALFWPGMNSEAKSYMEKCDVCLAVQDAPRKEPLIPHAFPMRPWAKIAADFLEFDGRILLITVDYFSNFIEVSRLTSKTTACVTRALSEIFARWGSPEVLITDNDGPFIGGQFAAFAKEWNFQRVTSSPNYAQSNGKAENAVRTIKRLFTKCKRAGQSEFRALLDWRNTPSEGFDSSPAQRIMGRRARTMLPCHESFMQPN